VERRPHVLVAITLAELGGAQTYVASLLPALAERADVVVAAHGPGPLREAVVEAGARFVHLEHVRRPLDPWRDLRGLLELALLMRRERFDVVHANSSKAGILARTAALLTRVPVRIFTVHGWAFSAHDGARSRFYLWADRLMSPLTTTIICVSETELRAGLAAKTCREARSVVIYNGVAAAAARAEPVDSAPPRILSVGRLRAPKDVVTLVRALALLERGSFSAAIVGDGPDAAKITPGAPVELLGTRRDVAELLAASDVFVLSSRSEGLPMSILEAMAAGLPVVASAVGGVPELVVDGETGLLVPPGDPAALASALSRLVADPDLRRRLGAAGRERAEKRFSLHRFREEHVQLYERLLAGSR
jgi:glycosyltransferase involved in cell wall biosynthesis